VNLKKFAQESPMRIAFCGASGTGKTTLARFLSERFELPLNPTGSRSTAKALGFDSPYDVDKACSGIYKNNEMLGETPEAAAGAALAGFSVREPGREHPPTCRGIFQRKLQLDKVAWELEHENFVTDRSTVDDFVYCAMHNYEAMDQEYIDRARQHLQLYDLIFFTPTGSFHDLGNDANRLTNAVYHHVFEQFAEGLLITWLGNDYNEVVRDVHWETLEDRQVLVSQAVSDWKRWQP
jgi:hypothetical protein